MTTNEIHQRLNKRAGKRIPIKHLMILIECYKKPVNEESIEDFLRYAW